MSHDRITPTPEADRLSQGSGPCWRLDPVTLERVEVVGTAGCWGECSVCRRPVALDETQRIARAKGLRILCMICPQRGVKRKNQRTTTGPTSV